MISNLLLHIAQKEKIATEIAAKNRRRNLFPDDIGISFNFSQVFKGNDRSGTVSHSLWPAITARFIRINAVSCGQSCALKAEFIGTYEGITQ